LKAVSTFLVLIYWISSWFPTSADRWAIFAVTVCSFGLLAALCAHRLSKEQRWPSNAVSALAFLLLTGGAVLAFMGFAVGTAGGGFITLFFVFGFVGYLLMINNILAARPTSRGYLGAGVVILFLLGTWSWASALGMYFHRGAASDTSVACILVPKSLRYKIELNSVWEMRLPEVVTSTTGPTGTKILNYHAILVAPINGRTEHYNWSKRWMRFELLEAKRNPYLPTECP